jgi:hypothetical protein
MHFFAACFGYYLFLLTDSFQPDDGGDSFLRSVGSYKIHRHNIQVSGILHGHHRDKLKSYMKSMQFGEETL